MHADDGGDYRRAASRPECDRSPSRRTWLFGACPGALDGYLANLNVDEVDLLLGLEGVLTDSDAHEMRSRIDD